MYFSTSADEMKGFGTVRPVGSVPREGRRGPRCRGHRPSAQCSAATVHHAPPQAPREGQPSGKGGTASASPKLTPPPPPCPTASSPPHSSSEAARPPHLTRSCKQVSSGSSDFVFPLHLAGLQTMGPSSVQVTNPPLSSQQKWLQGQGLGAVTSIK